MLLNIISKVLGVISPGLVITKRKVILFLLILVLSIFNVFLLKQLSKSKAKNVRQSQNIENLINNFDTEIQQERAKTGELVATAGALSIERESFEKINSELNDKLKSLKFKVKNLQSITSYGVTSKINIDSIGSKQVVATIDTLQNTLPNVQSPVNQFEFKNEDKFVNIDGKINVHKTDTSATPYITDLNIKTNDSLIIIPEIQKKRVWLFFKKRVGVKLNIVSESPYTNIDYIKHYNFTDYTKK